MVSTPVISGYLYHLLSGMSHQVHLGHFLGIILMNLPYMEQDLFEVQRCHLTLCIAMENGP